MQPLFKAAELLKKVLGNGSSMEQRRRLIGAVMKSHRCLSWAACTGADTPPYMVELTVQAHALSFYGLANPHHPQAELEITSRLTPTMVRVCHAGSSKEPSEMMGLLRGAVESGFYCALAAHVRLPGLPDLPDLQDTRLNTRHFECLELMKRAGSKAFQVVVLGKADPANDDVLYMLTTNERVIVRHLCTQCIEATQQLARVEMELKQLLEQQRQLRPQQQRRLLAGTSSTVSSSSSVSSSTRVSTVRSSMSSSSSSSMSSSMIDIRITELLQRKLLLTDNCTMPFEGKLFAMMRQFLPKLSARSKHLIADHLATTFRDMPDGMMNRYLLVIHSALADSSRADGSRADGSRADDELQQMGPIVDNVRALLRWSMHNWVESDFITTVM